MRHAQSVFLNRSCRAGSDKQHDVGKCARIPTKVSACKGADWNGACQLVLFCSEELQPLAAGPSHRQRAPQAVSGDIKGQKTGKTTHGRDCTSEAVLCLQDKQAPLLLTAACRSAEIGSVMDRVPRHMVLWQVTYVRHNTGKVRQVRHVMGACVECMMAFASMMAKASGTHGCMLL